MFAAGHQDHLSVSGVEVIKRNSSGGPLFLVIPPAVEQDFSVLSTFWTQ